MPPNKLCGAFFSELNNLMKKTVESGYLNLHTENLF